MLNMVTGIINFRAAEANQTLDIKVDGAIPQVLVGDDQRLAQVVTNLLSNAVKFSPEGGVIKITAALLSSEDGFCTIQIDVKDDGIGINEEQQSRLFTSFEQAESGTSRKFGGTGLGLAISKRIVEKMDGTIWIDSEVGKGSTFAFTAKLRVGNAEEIEQVLAASNSGQLEQPSGGGESAAAALTGGTDDTDEQVDLSAYTVLLVEDIEINREIARALLEPTGLNIVEAEDGKVALQKFKANPELYGLILMDVQMPEMDGYTATRHIRSLALRASKTVPIVAMTANVFREDVDKAIASGMNAHIGKPINMDELIQTLLTYLVKK
jgi:CheY-like chemotaxis protein